MPEHNAEDTASRLGNHSGQWGLASLLLSSLVIIMFPLMVGAMFAAMMGAYEDPFVESRDIDLGVLAAQIVVGGLFCIALFAFACGVIGLASALFRKQSFGLSLAGTANSVLAVAVAVTLLLGMMRSVEWIRSLQKTRYGPDGIQRPTPEQMRR